MRVALKDILYQGDPDKQYWLMPMLVEAERLEEDTTMVTAAGDSVVAKQGAYIISVRGEARSIVDEGEFAKHYVKRSKVPRKLKRSMREIADWLILR